MSLPITAGIQAILRRRSGRTLAAGGTAIAGRVAGAVFTLLSIPLLTSHLGADGYGAWAAVLALAVIAGSADLGASYALTTPLAEHFAEDDWGAAAALLWTTIALLALIAAAGVVVVAVVIPAIPIADLLGAGGTAVEGAVAATAVAAIVISLVAMPFTLTERLLVAAQRGYVWAAWAFAGNALAFGGVVLATLGDWSMPATVVAFTLPQLLVAAGATALAYGRSYPRLRPAAGVVQPALAGSIFRRSGLMLVSQVASIVAFNSDVIVTGAILDAGAAATYAVSWRLAIWVPGLLVMALGFLWPAMVEARARDDARWLRRAVAVALAGGCALALVSGVLFVLLGDRAVGIISSSVERPPLALRLALGTWGVVTTASAVGYYVLLAFDRLALQARLAIAMAVVNIGLSILFTATIGISGAAWATVAAYGLVMAVPYAVAVRRCLR